MSADPVATTAPQAPAGNAAYWQPHIQAWKASRPSARRCLPRAIAALRPLSVLEAQAFRSRVAEGVDKRIYPSRAGIGSGPRGLTIHLPGGLQIGGIDADNVDLLPRLVAQL